MLRNSPGTPKEPGGICIPGRVYEDAIGKIALQAGDIGEQALKNIGRPVRALLVSIDSRPSGPDAPAIAVP
jgi:adenylate cyclase